MAFVFAGKGIAELQEGGVIGTTVLGWAPRIPALGIYPTVESLALQVCCCCCSWPDWSGPSSWSRVACRSPANWCRSRRPAIEPPAAAREPPIRLSAHCKLESDMLRSLERMDADLAELRAEVERLRGLLARRAQRGS